MAELQISPQHGWIAAQRQFAFVTVDESYVIGMQYKFYAFLILINQVGQLLCPGLQQGRIGNRQLGTTPEQGFDR